MMTHTEALIQRAEDYRANARTALDAMHATTLPELREKHRGAAERWLRLAQSTEAMVRRAEVAGDPADR
ncbi:MAG TPA: hypothetical protein VIO94_10800 [Phenylobacterium sp.]